MKHFLKLCPLILPFSSMGCVTSASKVEQAVREAKVREAAYVAEQEKPVGVIDSVTSRDFVLVRTFKKGMASSKAEWEVWRGLTKVGAIKLSGEEKDNWVAADILHGELEQGDVVRHSGTPPAVVNESLEDVSDTVSPLDIHNLPELRPPPGGEPFGSDSPAVDAASPVPTLSDTVAPVDEAPPPLPDWADPNWQNDTVSE